jgi:hypothetical protein
VRIAYVLNLEDLRASVRVLEAGLVAYRRLRGLPAPAAEIASPARS